MLDGMAEAVLFPSWLADHQHFTNVIARKKEFDRGEIAEEGLDVAVIEHALQLETFRDGGMDRSGRSATGFAA